MKKYLYFTLLLTLFQMQTALGEVLNVSFEPETLSLGSKGKWVTCYIKPPADCDAAGITAGSLAIAEVSINGGTPSSVWLESTPSLTEVVDHDADGVMEIAVKFSRPKLQALIRQPGTVTLRVEANSCDKTYLGSDTIRAIKYWTLKVGADFPSGIKPKEITITSAAGNYTLTANGSLTLSDVPPAPFLLFATMKIDPVRYSCPKDVVPVAISVFSPESGENRVSCLETALAVMRFNNLLFTVPPHLNFELLALLRSIPEVQSLGSTLCLELSRNPCALVLPSMDLLNAKATANAKVREILENFSN